MKKLLSLFLALLILICTFSACAGNAAKPETPSSAASSDSTRPVVGISMSTQTQARQLKDVEYLRRLWTHWATMFSSSTPTWIPQSRFLRLRI